MIADTTQYRLYEAASVSGGKLWAIGVSDDAFIRIRYGAKDRPARFRELPMKSVEDTESEVRKRTTQKLREGYTYIGMALFDGRRVVPDSFSKDTHVFWEIHSAIDRYAFVKELRWMVEQLSSGAVPCQIRFSEEQYSIYVGDEPAWVLGYDQGGMNADDRGGGAIKRQDLIPLLIMLRLQRVFPRNVTLSLREQVLDSVTLTTEDAVFGAHLFDPDLVVELGSRLDLCLKRVSLAAIAPQDQGVWF